MAEPFDSALTIPARQLAGRHAPVVAVLPLRGVIGGGGRRSLVCHRIEPLLEKAFAFRRLVAVALVINSPGGSASQTSLISGRIRRHAEKKGVPVLAFCEEVAASGGYWLACTASRIYADPSSIIGSIGVIHAGFGMSRLIERIGLERRVHTAGRNKFRLDPFRPEREEDVAHLRTLQDSIHRHFREVVSKSRGERLDTSRDGEIFSGDFWLAGQAREMGLIDGLGECRETCQRMYGDQVVFRQVSGREGIVQRLAAGRGLADAIESVEERLFYASVGLPR